MGTDVVERRRESRFGQGERGSAARLSSIGPRLNHVKRVGARGVAGQLGVGDRAPARGRLGLLEHQQRRPFAHDEAVALLVEGTRRLGRAVVVTGREGADDVERTECQRAQRHLHPARDRRVDLAGPDRRHGLADRDGARGAGVRGREDRAVDLEGDADVGRCRPAEDCEGEVGGHGADAAGHVPLVLLLGIDDPAEGAAEVDPDPVRRGRPVSTGRQPRVLERHSSRRQAELAEPIELARGLRRHERVGLEVVDLGRDLRPERARIEAIDPPDRRAAGSHTAPEGVATEAYRRDEAEPGDPDPPSLARGHRHQYVPGPAVDVPRSPRRPIASAMARSEARVRLAIGRTNSRSTTAGKASGPSHWPRVERGAFGGTDARS